MRKVWIPSLPQGPERQSLELELNHLEEVHSRVHRRQTQVLEFLRQDQEINFTRSVERLTIIAFLFLPFSTMATILSIDDTMRFGVFFALAIPVSMICIAFGIRGISLAEVSTWAKDLTKNIKLWCDVTSRKLFLFPRSDGAVAEPDLESRTEVTGEFKIHRLNFLKGTNIPVKNCSIYTRRCWKQNLGTMRRA